MKQYQVSNTTRKFCVTFLALALAFQWVTSWAQEEAPEVAQEEEENLFYAEFGLGLYSADVWRGMIQNDEPVWTAGATFGLNFQECGRLYVDFSTTFDVTRRNDQTAFGGLNAIDYLVGYEFDVGDFTLGAGHVWHTYPKANGPDYDASTREFFATIAYNNDYVVPFAEAYYDYSVVEGVYAFVGLRKEVQVMDQLTVGAEVTIGGESRRMNKYYYDGHTSRTGLSDFNAALFAQYDLTEHIFVGATLAWASTLDSRLEDVWFKDHAPWGGINFGVAF